MENIQKKFREIDLLDFSSFLVRTFFNFLAHCGIADMIHNVLSDISLQSTIEPPNMSFL